MAAKDARIDALLVQVAELTAQVQALVLRLGKDSSTSSKPPSSDGPDRRPRGGSSRKSSGRRPGKQPGDPGTALRLVEDPDERIGIPAPAACSCGTSLVEEPVAAVRRRQVHDLPPIPEPVVTEYAADVKCCPGCRANVTGEFPAGVNGSGPVRARDHHRCRRRGGRSSRAGAPFHGAGDGTARDGRLDRVRCGCARSSRPPDPRGGFIDAVKRAAGVRAGGARRRDLRPRRRRRPRTCTWPAPTI